MREIDFHQVNENYRASFRRLALRLGLPEDRWEDFLQLAYEQICMQNRYERPTMYDIVRRATLLVETEYS